MTSLCPPDYHSTGPVDEPTTLLASTVMLLTLADDPHPGSFRMLSDGVSELVEHAAGGCAFAASAVVAFADSLAAVADVEPEADES